MGEGVSMRERPVISGDDAKRFLAEEKRVDTSRQEQIIRMLEAEVLQLQRNILLALQEVGSLRKENKLVRGRLEKADRVVECAITAREAWESYRAAHDPDREIYRYQAFEKVMRELGEVVAAYDGAANGS